MLHILYTSVFDLKGEINIIYILTVLDVTNDIAVNMESHWVKLY
jgi:hypothetical protein